MRTSASADSRLISRNAKRVARLKTGGTRMSSMASARPTMNAFIVVEMTSSRGSRPRMSSATNIDATICMPASSSEDTASRLLAMPCWLAR